MNRYIIERRGGFAGLEASGAIDGDALSPGDRQALEQLIDSEGTLAGDSGADRYTYVVTHEVQLSADVPVDNILTDYYYYVIPRSKGGRVGTVFRPNWKAGTALT